MFVCMCVLNCYECSAICQCSFLSLTPSSVGWIITPCRLQVFTLGHLMPKSAGDDDATAIWQIDPSRLVGMGMGGLVQDAGAEQQQSQQQQQEQDSPTQRHATAATTNGYRMGGNAGAYGGEPGSSSAYISQPSDPSSSGIASTSSNAASTSSSLALATTSASTSSIPKSQKLRVRRSTFVPGWAVPPRVLLVDDDAVSRKLSSKFLQVFGCTIDVAVDGVVAVNKMNLEKYDLVLMVRFYSLSLFFFSSWCYFSDYFRFFLVLFF